MSIVIDVDYIEVSVGQKLSQTAWYKATISDIVKYKNLMDSVIDSLCIPVEAIRCQDIHCKKHIPDVEKLYDMLINEVCLFAGKQVLPSSGKCDNIRKVPGWNEYVAHKKEYALSCHWLWKEAGKPNSGVLFEHRKQARAEYHHAVNKVKQNEDRMRSEKMVHALRCNDHKNLWCEVNKLKARKKTLPVMVDGIKGDANIAGIFANKYEQLYTSVPYGCELEQVRDDINVKLNDFCPVDVQASQFNVNEVKTAVKQISCGKSDGQLGLFSDHIIHGTDKFYKLLTDLFNSMIIHGVSPGDMLNSVLLPIVKNKRVQSSNSDNFRAVCLQSALCKLLDMLVLHREEHTLITSELQFGFKAKHSTALATSVVLQTVDYYIDNGGRVYGLALDATKAFDRVEYSRLFALLMERGLNPLYVRLIMEMYTNQRMCVRYNGSKSQWFTPTNGVKQGSVLSPTLFAIYIDGMLKELEASKVGCLVGNKYCGVVGYADDVILLSPTQGAMDRMIKVCENYAEHFMIKFNGKKCQAIVFQGCKSNFEPEFYVNNQKVAHVKELVYLGYLLNGDRADPMVKPIVNEFNRKFNAFVGDLDCLSSEVKGSLYMQYCTSLYGVTFSQLYHSDFNKLKVTWRKALRRLFKLPYRTHCNLLPCITSILPVDVLIDLRFLKHMSTGFKHKNSTVRFLFSMCSTLDMSLMARNFRYICHKYCIKSCDVINCSPFHISKIVKDKYYNSVSECDKRTGSQIMELIHLRDDLYEDFGLQKKDICDIIEYLATN